MRHADFGSCCGVVAVKFNDPNAELERARHGQRRRGASELISIKIGVVARVDVVVCQRAAHVHVDVLSEARALFDGARRGEVLVLILTLGLLVELELARAATHFL